MLVSVAINGKFSAREPGRRRQTAGSPAIKAPRNGKPEVAGLGIVA